MYQLIRQLESLTIENQVILNSVEALVFCQSELVEALNSEVPGMDEVSQTRH